MACLKRAVERDSVDIVAALAGVGGENPATGSHRFAIFPASHWCGSGEHSETLAAVVTPSATALAAVLRDVSSRAQESRQQGVLEEHQSGSAARAQRMAEACFNALAARAIQCVPGQLPF